jgi:regulator of sigma E protease
VSLLIVFHEFGHYLCARASGMRVDRFSVLGIGPVIWRLGNRGGTEFVISAIPFGAYVHIVGMEAGDDPAQALPPLPEKGQDGVFTPPPVTYDANDPYLYRNRPIWARMLAILGGPLANYVAATALYVGLFVAVGPEEPVTVRATSQMIESAATAGVKQGDEFIRANGQELEGVGPAARLAAVTEANKGQTIELVVKRQGEQVPLQVPVNEEGRIGVGLRAGKVTRVPVSTGEGALMGLKEPWIVSWKNLQGLGQLFTGKAGISQMSGPVGIVQGVAQAAEEGPASYIKWLAMISALLGLFNLLPLPALDGGRMVFMLIDAVLRRPVNKHVEEMIHGYGMLALLGLILYVTLANDFKLSRLFN